MAAITRTQVINKPVEEVFDLLADMGSYAKWNPTIRSSRWLDDQPIGNGAGFEWGLRGPGMVVQELQEFEPPVQLRIVTDLKPVKGGHRFRPTANGDATRIDHELGTSTGTPPLSQGDSALSGQRLEVVLRDDAKSDGTFEMGVECVCGVAKVSASVHYHHWREQPEDAVRGYLERSWAGVLRLL